MVPQSTYEKFEDWVSRHKLVTGLIVLATGTVMYQCYRRSHFCRKTRRAKRARNGGRLEVVVVAGKPSLPLTKAIALDLERRGHIVYIVCNSVEDDAMVRSMSRMDIKPLAIDIADVSFLGEFKLELCWTASLTTSSLHSLPAQELRSTCLLNTFKRPMHPYLKQRPTT